VTVLAPLPAVIVPEMPEYVVVIEPMVALPAPAAEGERSRAAAPVKVRLEVAPLPVKVAARLPSVVKVTVPSHPDALYATKPESVAVGAGEIVTAPELTVTERLDAVEPSVSARAAEPPPVIVPVMPEYVVTGLPLPVPV
jgi:hypothetical protein